MAFDVVIEFTVGGDVTLAINPDFTPSITHVHDEVSEPPRTIGIDETWNLESVIQTGTPMDDWLVLRDRLNDLADPPNKVRVRENAVDKMVIGDGTHELFKVELIENPPRAKGRWGSHVPFVLRFTARIVVDAVIIRARLEFDYNDAGLLSRRFTGEVQTVSGTSAQAQARILGALAAPAGSFGAATAGPEGLDIRVLDGDRDTRAEFEQILVEHGIALPGGVNSISLRIETSTEDDKTTTRTTVDAAGPGALVAVRSFQPAGATKIRIVEFRAGRRASAEFVEEGGRQDERVEAAVKRTFRIRGGGAPLTLIPVTGPFEPLLQKGAQVGSVITETIEITDTDVSSLADLEVPVPPEALEQFLDGAESEETIPERVSAGVDAAGDSWIRKVTRVYKVPGEVDFGALFELVLDLTDREVGEKGVGGAKAGGGGDFARLFGSRTLKAGEL